MLLFAFLPSPSASPMKAGSVPPHKTSIIVRLLPLGQNRCCETHKRPSERRLFFLLCKGEEAPRTYPNHTPTCRTETQVEPPHFELPVLGDMTHLGSQV